MADVSVTVNLNLAPLERFASEFERQLGQGGSGPLADGFDRCAARYLAFLQERFDRLSRGGGEWPPLAASTLARRAGAPVRRLNQALEAGQITQQQFNRRIGRARRSASRSRARLAANSRGASILRDTNTLFTALDPSIRMVPGKVYKRGRMTVEFGYGGPSGHPSGPASIAQIARFHQDGGPRLPRRRIIVGPDQALLRAIETELNAAVQRQAQALRIDK